MLNELEFVRSRHKRQENQPAKPCSAFDTFCSFVGLEAHISPRKISVSVLYPQGTVWGRLLLSYFFLLKFFQYLFNMYLVGIKNKLMF